MVFYVHKTDTLNLLRRLRRTGYFTGVTPRTHYYPGDFREGG
jgi:hypothetical protein